VYASLELAAMDVELLTYALRVLHDAGVMKHLAFKGGTCLRKNLRKTHLPGGAYDA